MKKRLQLPSGRVVAMTAEDGQAPRARRKGAPLFSELVDLAPELVDENGHRVELLSLELRDFHALRALATRFGLLAEETIEIDCKNCGEVLQHAPCAALEPGPFVDRELGDPELDAVLDLSVPHDAPGLGVVRLANVTARDAAPLHRALRRRRFPITAGVVRGMGLWAIGDETEAQRIARRLERCPEAAWRAVCDLFLRAHYPPRLFSIARCPACGARNDVDAPFEREFEPGDLSSISAASNGDVSPEPSRRDRDFPDFEAFAVEARARAEGLVGPDVALIVDAGVPACDDGGEPLLGSYVPPSEGGGGAPSRSPEITLYYRTFKAIWQDEGPYDWRAELAETLEHEMQHHEGHLVGHDPMDEEERREIDEEARRVIGKKAIVRGGVAFLGADILGFLRRTWIVWLLLALGFAIVTYVEQR